MPSDGLAFAPEISSTGNIIAVCSIVFLLSESTILGYLLKKQLPNVRTGQCKGQRPGGSVKMTE